ncbi:DcuS/MalK family sensor histidine kinase [Oceanobacillus saliphilus]|uniref:DcuS/MalK family sensor histidine kinase n=1 Tax=Oceanobacillus saliphilus TaxID=2925834 RepID=UPI00201D6889|nr:DcuS/MalK family sensor histidine kinase [Oceanobacillus saliphilus]
MRTPFQPDKKRSLKLQTLILLLVFLIVLISVIVTNVFLSNYIENRTQEHLSQKVQDIARMVAHSDVVIDGLQGDQPPERIQNYANEMRELTDTGFIVVLDMNLIRLSHPLAEEVGKSFYNREDAQDSLNMEEYFSIEQGPLGLGMRVFTPVTNEIDEQIGVVVVGISLDTVQEQISQSQRIINNGIIIQLVIGSIGAFFLSKYIKKILFGLEPKEIAQLLEERSIMLESVKEGIIAVNKDAEISLVNKEALKLMNVSDSKDITGEPIENYMPIFAQVVRTGKPEENHEQDFYGNTVLINSAPIYIDHGIVGGIATFRDKTEINQLSEQLTGVKNYSEALRAHSHEFKNKLHVILGMLHMKKYEELEKFIPSMVDNYQTEIGYIVQRIKHPVFAGFLLGKMSKARELGITFSIDGQTSLTNEVNDSNIHELITITGSIIENAFEAVQLSDIKEVSFLIYPQDDTINIEVNDTGLGIPDNLLNKIFEKGFSTKGTNRGYGLFLLKQAVEKFHGELEIESGNKQGTAMKVLLEIPPEENKDD